MESTVVVAIIGAAATVVAPLLVWLVGRVDRRDDRQWILQDLEILEGLQPGSNSHWRLDRLVHHNITVLVRSERDREWRRKSIRDLVSLLAPLAASLALLSILTLTDVSPPLRVLVWFYLFLALLVGVYYWARFLSVGVVMIGMGLRAIRLGRARKRTGQRRRRRPRRYPAR